MSPASTITHWEEPQHCSAFSVEHEYPPINNRQKALLEVGETLREGGYRFTTPTPATHARVIARRPEAKYGSLTDVFGWSRTFGPHDVPPDFLGMLDRAGALAAENGKFRSKIRFSTLNNLLLAHSAYPTTKSDSVFFGPDTYRFARAIINVLELAPPFSPCIIVDIGAGSGAGGLLSGALLQGAERIVLSDINTEALALCEVNTRLNGIVPVQCLKSDLLNGFDGDADFIIANPPYLVDADQRAYRHGGGRWGCDLAIRILKEGLPRLSRAGKLLLYTGSPIVDGNDIFLESVRGYLEQTVRTYRYQELDPDVFGEELDRSPYDRADRIAAVMLCVSAEDIRGKS